MILGFVLYSPLSDLMFWFAHAVMVRICVFGIKTVEFI